MKACKKQAQRSAFPRTEEEAHTLVVVRCKGNPTWLSDVPSDWSIRVYEKCQKTPSTNYRVMTAVHAGKEECNGMDIWITSFWYCWNENCFAGAIAFNFYILFKPFKYCTTILTTLAWFDLWELYNIIQRCYCSAFLIFQWRLLRNSNSRCNLVLVSSCFVF